MNVAGDSIAEAGVAVSVVESVAAVSSPLVVSMGVVFPCISRMVVKVHS